MRATPYIDDRNKSNPSHNAMDKNSYNRGKFILNPSQLRCYGSATNSSGIQRTCENYHNLEKNLIHAVNRRKLAIKMILNEKIEK